MGVDISRDIIISKGFTCLKCCICDSVSEKNQKINTSNKSTNNYINNKNTFEVQDNKHSLSQEQIEKIYYKNKLKKLFFENHVSSITNSSKTDLKTIKAIYIQSYIRGYFVRKRLLQQKIIFNKINNINTKKDSENENIETEDNLVISLSMNGTIFTGDNSCKSSLSIISKNNKINSNRGLSRFLINKRILSFNLKSKNNIKYKYYGFLKVTNNNKQSYVTTNGIVKNSFIIDAKIKNGFGKLIFDDNTLFKCHFNDNKANGIGQYIDQINNEEFIGEYKSNAPNGYGIYRNILTERKCLGYFTTNGLNGIGIEESIEDGYIYYGEFNKNQKHGNGVLQWKEGIIYEGQFFKNQLSGYAIIKYPQNKIYKGQMNIGKMEGFGVFDWGGGKKYLGYYKNDKRNGFGIFLWKSPIINIGEEISDLNEIKAYIGFWEEGNMNGIGLKISDGIIKYGVWKNGVKMEWIDREIHIKKHIQNNQKKYLKILLGKKEHILKLLSICAIQDNENFKDEEEFEF